MSTPPVPRRVHVAPLGFEDARIREPLEGWRADVVVAVAYDGGEDVPFLEALLSDLEAAERLDLEVRSCDIFDLYEALGTIAGAIDDYADDDVYVNVSAGSKITAIAGMIACMATGATPIYARPDYGAESTRVPDAPLHDAVAETFALPTYPIDRPDDRLLAFLSYIRETTESGGSAGRYRGPSKKALIEFGRAAEIDVFEDADLESEKGYYRILDAYVLDPLREREYVELERVGRRKYVTLTPAGENALRAFGHRVSTARE